MNDTIKQNVLKLQNAGATPNDIETYVKGASQNQGGGNNFLQNMVMDPLTTLVGRPAINAVRTMASGVAPLVGGDFEKRTNDWVNQPQNLHIPILGDMTVEPQKPINQGGASQIAGNALKSAAYLIPGEAAANVGSSVFKGAIGKAIGGGALASGQFGLMHGAGDAMTSNDNPTAGDILKGSASEGAMDALTGGLTAGGLATLSKGVRHFFPGTEDIVNNRVDSLTQVENNNKYLRNVSRDAESKGIDVKNILANTDLLHGIVDDNGNISTTAKGGPISEFNKFIEPLESVVSDAIDKEGVTIPITDVEQLLKEDINSSNLAGRSKINAINTVNKEIQGLMLDVDAEGNIPLSRIHDAKITTAKNVNYMDPGSMNIDRQISNVYKNIVEANSSADIKALNSELGQYYTIRDYLEALDGRKVKGGKLGKYFAETIGGIAGSHFGPIGTIVGAETAGKLKGNSLAGTFGGEIGKDMEPSPLMMSTIENNQLSNGVGQPANIQTSNNIQTNGIGPNSTTNGNAGKASLGALLGLSGLGAGIAASTIPSSTTTYEAPKQAKEQPKVDINDTIAKIKYNETRGEKNPYSFSRDSGNKALGRALGAYQVTEGELKTYSNRFLGKTVTPKEFLNSPALQDQYIRAKVESLAGRGLREDEILAAHNKGMSDLTTEGRRKLLEKGSNYVGSANNYKIQGSRSYQDLLSEKP